MAPKTGKFAKMSKQELEVYLAKMEKKLNELEKSTYQISDFGAEETGQRTGEQLSQMNDTLRQIVFAGGLFARGQPLEKGLSNTIQMMQKLTGSTKIGADAFQALSTNFEAFGRLAQVVAKDGAQANIAVEQLAAQAATLKEFGLSVSDFSTNMEVALNVFGQSKDEIAKLNTGLVKFAEQVKLLPSVVSKNFQLVAQSIMYDGQKVQQQFASFQEMSAKTGVKVGSLVSSFGSPMDTIGGASSMAGKLNAVLGTRFSGNQLLMMDEDDRMALIRNAIMGNNFISKEIADGTKIGKFALNSVSSILNMSPPDAKRFITTGKLKGELAVQAGKDFGAATEARRTKPDGKPEAFSLTRDVQAMSTELKKYTTILKDVALNVRDRAMVEEIGRFTSGGPGLKAEPVTPEAIMRMGRTFQEFDKVNPTAALAKILDFKGPDKDKFKTDTAKAMILVPRILDLTRKASMLPMDDQRNKTFAQKIRRLINAATKKNANIGELTQRANALTKESDQSMPFNLTGDDKIDPFEQGVLRGLMDDTAEFRKNVRLFRSKGVNLGGFDKTKKNDLESSRENIKKLMDAGMTEDEAKKYIKDFNARKTTPPNKSTKTTAIPRKNSQVASSGDTPGDKGSPEAFWKTLQAQIASMIVVPVGTKLKADLKIGPKTFSDAVELSIARGTATGASSGTG